MDVSINSTVVLHSQCIHITNHHIVHLKYLKILLVNYTSVMLKRKSKEKPFQNPKHFLIVRLFNPMIFTNDNFSLENHPCLSFKEQQTDFI